MRVIICGGRDFGKFEDIDRFLYPELYIKRAKEQCFQIAWLSKFQRIKPITVVIEGEADGADKTAKKWAIFNRIEIEPYEAEWYVKGHMAGPERNQEMIDRGKPDLIIAFPGGKGTQDMINRARKNNIDIVEVKYEDGPIGDVT